MTLKFLPNTAITSMEMGGTIYAYAQVYEGDLYEISGHMKTTSPQIYTHDKKKSGFAVDRIESDEIAANAPKMFTPVAAAPYTKIASGTKNIRYLFYVDDKNMLRDVLNEGNGWKDGVLAAARLQCAQYSKLAAITIAGNVYNDICLYYQVNKDDAAIKMVNFNPEYGRWTEGTPNLTDPPLLGTSLTAVHPRKGILVNTTEGTVEARQPVYYLQMDDLRLGHAQGISDPVVMSGLEVDGTALVFSPQTSLTAVADASKLYMIYKPNNGKIKMIEIMDGKPRAPEKIKVVESMDGKPRAPEELNDIDTTPMSAIAACLSPDKSSTRIILFYQSLNKKTMQVNLRATTLYKAQPNSTEWTASTPDKLGA